MEIIIGKTAGFCYGVKRAIEGSSSQIDNKKGKDIFCLGELVHNRQVIENLTKKGIKFVNEISEVKNTGSKLIIRAHGIEKEKYEEAEDKKIELIDYTCPNVLQIHKIAEEYSKKGYFIFLCGSEKHPENIGTISYCGKNFCVIEELEETIKAVEKFKRSDIGKLLLLSQTTYSLEKFHKIKEKIQENLKEGTKFVIKNTICKATELRQKETAELSKRVEYMIIIGGKNSSNTKKLYDIAKTNCENCICIETSDQINIDEVKKYNKIGIMAGASTPQESIEEVLEKIENV